MQRNQKIIFMRGLPGSGKSTWAKAKVQEEPNIWYRINRDTLREMIVEPKLSIQEKKVAKCRDALIVHAIQDGQNVIIDDTNLDIDSIQAHVKDLLVNTVHTFTVDFEVQDFTWVPLEECIKRDKNRRGESVGEHVIRRMHHQYLAPKQDKPAYNPSLPWAIICDLDGTLAKIIDRSPYEAKYETDVPRESLTSLLRAHYFHYNDKIVFVSAREDQYREKTIDWLRNTANFWDLAFDLIMRKTEDFRNDAIVKEEIYENQIKPNYNVRFVLDDRDRVVQMWRDKGLDCLQVDYGEF